LEWFFPSKVTGMLITSQLEWLSKPVKEFRFDKNIFSVPTPRASEKSERRSVNLPNEMETVTCFNDHANPTFVDKHMKSSLDMLATNMDCFPSSITLTYEAYNSPKWQKVSFSESKFIVGNESDSSYSNYLKLEWKAITKAT
jgi:hypothetical protein